MQNFTNKFAAAVLALGVSGAVLSPVIANAAETQAPAAQTEFVPNNTNGHSARKEYDIWKAHQTPVKATPKDSQQFAAQGSIIMAKAHEARVALDRNDIVTAKKALNEARALASDIYNKGGAGNLIIAKQMTVNQDVLESQVKNSAGDPETVLQPVITDIGVTNVNMSFGTAKSLLNLAHQELINSNRNAAKHALANLEHGLSLQTVTFVPDV
ncbi:YfdX family protein [Thalassospira lucentensis]|uniref:YfdX family protein n=1 Tax=Thalassospira lucentensis TaxID=168935 RepID=UPI003AA8A9EF